MARRRSARASSKPSAGAPEDAAAASAADAPEADTSTVDGGSQERNADESPDDRGGADEDAEIDADGSGEEASDEGGDAAGDGDGCVEMDENDAAKDGIDGGAEGDEGSGDDDDEDDEDDDEDGGEGALISRTGLAALRGVGEGLDSSDSDAPLEALAVSSLPGHVVRTQRNDEVALDRKLADVALFDMATPHGVGKLPFRESLATPMLLDAPLPDDLAHDDLAREKRFAELATAAVHDGLARLRKMGVKFRRPDDYFAEMAKSDDHMTKVKARMLHEKERIDAALRQRNNRDIRKNKKKVRQEQMEREQDKKQRANEEIDAVRRTRKDRLRARAAAHTAPGVEDVDDEFPVDLLDVEEYSAADAAFKRAAPASRPKANAGRKSDRKGRDAHKPPDRPRYEDDLGDGDEKGGARTLGRGRSGRRGREGRGAKDSKKARPGGPTGGIKKKNVRPGGKVGSKKRPGKSRRTKGRARS